MTEATEQPRVGRRPMLTDARQQLIVDAVAAGNYLKVAAQYAGVSERSLLGWLARGRDAQAAVDAHPAGRLFCPSCDRDRTDEVDAVDDANVEATARHEQALAAYRATVAQLVDPEGPQPEPPDEPGIAVLDRCPTPTCRTTDRPAEWQLDPAEAVYLQFLQEVTRAETTAEVAAVTAWRSAFTEDWRAARDYLVRRRPDRWAATTRIQMTTEEAERRIDDALGEAVAALTGDTDLTDDELRDTVADLDLDSDAHPRTGHDDADLA